MPTTSARDSWSTDVDFTRRMIWHQQQDLDLATLAQQTTSASAEVKQLARVIQRTHGKNTRELEGWLRQWNIGTSGAADHAADGEQFEGDVQALKGASGSQFDRQWLKVMLEHSTVSMRLATELPASTTHADMVALANGLAVVEQDDITAAQTMLGGRD